MDSQRTLLEPLRRLDPEQIGSYVLLGRLGAGAMGRVYLGRSAAGRLVAVKTIKLEFAEEDDFRARFAQEVAAARRVNGVFTAGVVGADPDAEVPWLATAYVPAPSLDRLVRTCGPLPVPAVRWLAAGCAEALASIHDAGLVHRDLKPSNVLVAPDGPRVIDFGVARAAEPASLTSTHGSVGTPAYMAPEQARDTRQATTASDIFSLGSTLLFAASGHAPYQGQTATDILIRLVTEPPDLRGLPPELAGIVTGCLDRDPRRRPTSAALVGQLAPHVNAGIGRGFGSPLPESALGLIEEYRHGPPPPAGPAGADGDSTIGSAVRLPGRPPILARPAAGARRRDGAAGAAPVAGLLRAWRRGPGTRRGRAIARVAAAATGVAGLVVVGSLLGASISGGTGEAGGPDGDRAAQGQHPFPPPPQPPGGAPGIALSGPGGKGHGQQQIEVSQNRGDGYTVFVVHGNGWPPGQRITVRLAGRTSIYRPYVDLAGTFSYAINQAQEFFRGNIPPGSYTVVLTASGGEAAEVTFTVGRPFTAIR